MSATVTTVPSGTFELDRVHSSVGFSVKHSGVATFRGSFRDFDVALRDGRLTGVVQVASVDVADDNLAGHLQSPDFFDAERTPEIRFVSTEIDVDGEGRATVTGDLTIKGHTQRVGGEGTFIALEDRIVLSLEATIDRTQFGVNWNAPMPNGNNILGNDVKLVIDAQLTPAS